MEQRENKVITTLSLLAMIKKGISANKTSSSLSWKVMKKEKNKDTNKGCCIIILFTKFSELKLSGMCSRQCRDLTTLSTSWTTGPWCLDLRRERLKCHLYLIDWNQCHSTGFLHWHWHKHLVNNNSCCGLEWLLLAFPVLFPYRLRKRKYPWDGWLVPKRTNIFWIKRMSPRVMWWICWRVQVFLGVIRTT